MHFIGGAQPTLEVTTRKSETGIRDQESLKSNITGHANGLDEQVRSAPQALLLSLACIVFQYDARGCRVHSSTR